MLSEALCREGLTHSPPWGLPGGGVAALVPHLYMEGDLRECFYLETTTGSVQGLLLAECLGITPSSAQRILWDTED